jgi:hypothetical protein
MNFSELKTELGERGLARLGDTRLGVLVNRAVRELDSMERWPYREQSVTGTAPLAVSDLGFVDVVFDTTGTDAPIPMRSYGDLVRSYGDLSTTGAAPAYWYLAYPSGVPTVATFPVSSVTIGVQYYRVTPTLVNASDSPLAPVAYHGLYVDLAEKWALRSKSDYAAAQAVQADFDVSVAGMRLDLLYREGAGPSQVLATDGADY